jgi:hypothetical protein
VYRLNTSEGELLSDNATYWRAILLLSIMLPVGLFTGLKLAGIGQPLKLETITLSPVAWQFNRTSGFTIIEDTPNATYADDVCWMNFSVTIGSYVPRSTRFPYTLSMGIQFAATALIRDFSIKSLLVTFGKDPQPSAITVQITVSSFENLSLTGYSSGEDASIQLLGNGSADGVNCLFGVSWYLFTSNSVTSNREITFETTYFNGTAYKRIIQPFDMTLLGVEAD